MSTLNRKEDLLDLLAKPEFIQILSINSEQEYEEMDRSVSSEFYEYVANEWDEHSSGVDLFTTPTDHKGLGDPWGTWLEVVKLYGNYEQPYRVRALEYVPWGSDVDDSIVGDYKTLGQALDAAFNIHEHGNIELNVINEDEERGCYVRGDSKIDVPEHEEEVISDVAVAVNQLVANLAQLEEARKQAWARERDMLNLIHSEAWKAPLSLEDAKPVLAEFSKLLQDRKLGGCTESMLVTASVINDHLFAGKGALISYHSHALKHQYDNHGAAFAVLEAQEGKYTYVSAECGVHEGFDEALKAVSQMLEKQYENELVDPKRYWLDGELWEIDFADLEASKEERVLIEQPDEFNPYPEKEYLIQQALRDAVKPYRDALKERIGPVIREREARAAHRLSESSMEL